MKVAVALLCLFASVLGVAPVASARTVTELPATSAPDAAGDGGDATPATKAAGDSTSFVRVRDRRGDALVRAADVVAGSLHYGESAITVRALTDRFTGLRSFNWRVGITTMLWYLDTNGDGEDDFVVLLFNDGANNIHADIRDYSGNITLCQGRFRAKTSYQVRFPSACIESPARVRFQVAFVYDTKPKNPDPAAGRSIDIVPSRYSEAVIRPPRPTFFRELSARPVRLGESGTVSAELQTQSGGGVSNRRIRVYARPKGAQEFTFVGATRTVFAYGGDVSWTVPHVERTTDFQFRFPGSRHYLPSRSPVLRLDVVRDVTLASSRTDIPVGQSTILSGTVEPADSDVPVVVQRQDASGAWVDETTTTATQPTFSNTDAPSEYQVSVAPSTSGVFVYRTVAQGDEIFSNSPSFPVQVIVVQAEIAEVEAGNGAVADAVDPNGEFVTIRNTGAVTIYPTEWEIEANLTDRAVIAGGPVAPGESVQIHTGAGQNGGGRIYLGRSAPMWPESGGIARIYDQNGLLVDELQYAPQPS